MQTAVMRGATRAGPVFFAVYKYGASSRAALQVCATRYSGERPIISPLSAAHVGPTVEAAPPREARGGFSWGLAAPGDLATLRMMIGFYEKMTV